MTQGKAVDLLMREYAATEDFRDFFERVVSEWMGEVRNVTDSDLRGIRDMIRSMR